MTAGLVCERKPPSVVSLPGEEWRPIPGMAGRYWASTEGRIAGLRAVLRPRKNVDRSPTVGLCGITGSGNRCLNLCVAPLILTAFVTPKSTAFIPLFKDGDTSNARLANLRWTPRQGHYRGRDAHGRKPQVTSTTAGADQARIALDRDVLWTAAKQALPRTLDLDTLSDVAGDIVVAVLSGDLPPADIPARAGGFLRAHYAAAGFRAVSLDERLGQDESTWLDLLSEDEYRGRWECLGV